MTDGPDEWSVTPAEALYAQDCCGARPDLLRGACGFALKCPVCGHVTAPHHSLADAVRDWNGGSA